MYSWFWAALQNFRNIFLLGILQTLFNNYLNVESIILNFLISALHRNFVYRNYRRKFLKKGYLVFMCIKLFTSSFCNFYTFHIHSSWPITFTHKTFSPQINLIQTEFCLYFHTLRVSNDKKNLFTWMHSVLLGHIRLTTICASVSVLLNSSALQFEITAVTQTD